MKAIIYIPLILLALGACRTSKKKQSDYNREHHEERMEKQGSLDIWTQSDSSGRYWWYSTDMPFYYHPDSGLYGRKGILFGQESTLTRKEQHSQRESAIRDTKVDNRRSSHRQQEKNYSYWIVLGLAPLVLCYLVYRWKRKSK